MIIVTDENFEKEVLKKGNPVLVDFYADWCPPCKMLSPIFEKLDKEFENKVEFAKVNADSSPAISQKFGISHLPTVILFKAGEPADSFVGLRTEDDIKNWIKENLKK